MQRIGLAAHGCKGIARLPIEAALVHKRQVSEDRGERRSQVVANTFNLRLQFGFLPCVAHRFASDMGQRLVDGSEKRLQITIGSSQFDYAVLP